MRNVSAAVDVGLFYIDIDSVVVSFGEIGHAVLG